MHDDIAEPEIAVDDGCLVTGRNVLGQPCHEPLHRLDALRLGGAVLLRPPVDLPREIAPRLAEVGEAERLPILPVKPRQHVAHGLVDGRPFGGRASGQQRIHHDATRHPVHDIEDRTDHPRVVTEQPGLRHRHVRAAKRGQDAVFAVHGMRRRQKLARRLAPQHVFMVGGGETIRRVGLAALELAHRHRTAEARDALDEMALERIHIEAMRLPHRDGVRRQRGLDGHRAWLLGAGLYPSRRS